MASLVTRLSVVGCRLVRGNGDYKDTILGRCRLVRGNGDYKDTILGRCIVYSILGRFACGCGTFIGLLAVLNLE